MLSTWASKFFNKKPFLYCLGLFFLNLIVRWTVILGNDTLESPLPIRVYGGQCNALQMVSDPTLAWVDL